ncbi:hypothetical protein UC8_34120 [Roseimaritima ulvae]|uniref:Uncharacterized protein n=1 Tax=Roseimaritima ulvae TaxID=980254 RepID=A0A5B9R4J9_9BACT|nr:hypothetical protein UC8_34120 [Roseimaritima ulvae]
MKHSFAGQAFTLIALSPFRCRSKIQGTRFDKGMGTKEFRSLPPVVGPAASGALSAEMTGRWGADDLDVTLRLDYDREVAILSLRCCSNILAFR